MARWRSSALQDQDGVRSAHNVLSNFPSDPESAAVRTATRFRLHYTVLLLATLVPRRRLSFLLILATSNVAICYILLLRLLSLHRSIDPRHRSIDPRLLPLHRSIDPRLLTALFMIVTLVQLVLTRALKHLLLFLTPPCFFTLPSDREAAAVRTARNATRFRLHYTVLIWVILVATLVPRRRLSLLLLLATSLVAVSYILLLRALPNSALLHRSIDPLLVTALFLIVTVVQLVLTRALKHLLLSLAAGVSIVLIHTVFWVSDDPAAAAGPSPLIRKTLNRIAPPSDPEAAAVRVVRNATRFRLYYTVLLWVVLFATLVPRRPISLVCLLVTSEVAVSYCMLMRAFPDSAILHRFIDRRLVGALFLIVIVVELVLTGALQHLVLSMAAVVSVVLIHAIFWVEEKSLSEKEAADEDLEPIGVVL